MTATETAGPGVAALKQRYNDEIRASSGPARPRQRHAGAAAREDRHQHGRRRRSAAGEPARGRGARLETIAGQKPIVTRAKKSIAGFKLREGNAIGAKVTLARRPHVGVLRPPHQHRHPPHPRLPRPAPTRFDGHGNYTFGVTEQLIFPEIDYDRIDATRGMDITIVTTARTDAEGKALLDAFGFPFRREGQS